MSDTMETPAKIGMDIIRIDLESHVDYQKKNTDTKAYNRLNILLKQMNNYSKAKHKSIRKLEYYINCFNAINTIETRYNNMAVYEELYELKCNFEQIRIELINKRNRRLGSIETAVSNVVSTVSSVRVTSFKNICFVLLSILCIASALIPVFIKISSRLTNASFIFGVVELVIYTILLILLYCLFPLMEIKQKRKIMKIFLIAIGILLAESTGLFSFGKNYSYKSRFQICLIASLYIGTIMAYLYAFILGNFDGEEFCLYFFVIDIPVALVCAGIIGYFSILWMNIILDATIVFLVVKTIIDN